MFSKGLIDEGKEKISELFKPMPYLEILPELWQNEQRQKPSDNLKKILDISIDDVETQCVEVLPSKLNSADLEFSLYEQFNDLMLKSNPFEPEHRQSQLVIKAIAIYETAQQETKIFSFSSIQKINKAQALLK